MNLQPLTTKDIPAAVALQKAALKNLCTKDYGEDMCTQWQNDIEIADFASFKDGQYFTVKEDDTLIAMGGWTQDNLKLFYITPERVGQGLATQFFNALEAQYMQEKPKHWLVLATLTALPFYLKMGFKKIRTGAFTLKNGLDIPMWVLMKTYSNNLGNGENV